MWEENGVQEYEKSKRNWKLIVSEAISSCDVVVTFYKNSAGDESRLFEIPFFPTDYEIALSIKHGVPLCLYIINGKAVSDALKGVLALFGNQNIINSKPSFCHSEEAFVKQLLFDLKALCSKRTLYSNILVQEYSDFRVLHDLESYIEIISALRHSGEYQLGYELIRQNTDFLKFIPRTAEEKILKARGLALWANIYANRALYQRAINCLTQSIRLSLETSDYLSTFRYVQDLSGICNMAGMPRAVHLNNYGCNSTKVYKELKADYIDSKASIFRRMGEFEYAFNLLQRDSDWEKSPYSAAKYTFLKGVSGNKCYLNQSRDTMEKHILPWAKDKNKSVAYVLREAAMLAIEDSDMQSALRFLNEASDISESLGSTHTLIMINKIRNLYPKINL
ncbi:hypothetical protein GCM10027049_01560 [Mucilaginibacter puniceus]